jgi:UDP-GlcNAc:undecaprenyl-phosphate GlcNAc-1-phosphate transferase
MNFLLADFITFFISFSLSLILTPYIRRFAVIYNYISNPRDDRWHKKPTGLLGGISIFISMMIAWLFGALTFAGFNQFIQPMLPVAFGGAAIFCLGLFDDIFEINPQYKLIGQVIIASVLVLFGFQVGWFDSKTANLVVSIFWIVGITNAFNLLDNMDGLSAGIACIAGFFLFLWLFVMPGSHHLIKPVQLMLSAYLGSLLGFLIYNFSPASIFMGDAGSLLIGFIIACLSVLEVPSHVQGGTLFNQLSVVAVPCFILFIPILDTAFVSFMRRLFSRSIFQGGRDHSSHRMVAIGFSERKAVVVLYLFAVISGLLALCIYPLDYSISVVIITLYLILVLLFWIYLANVKVYSETSEPTGVLVPVFIKAGYWRTLFAILLDLILITVAYYISYLLRFEWHMGPDFAFFLKSLPILFASQIFCFYIFGVYDRLWWGSRLGDLGIYVKGVTAGTVLAILIILFLYRFQSFSRAVFVIYWGVMLIFVLFSRFFFRILDEWCYRENKNGKPTLIYGAGIGGLMVVHEIETNHSLGLSIVGFIDDNPLKTGKRIHGYPVLGGHDQLDKIVKKYHIKEIVVSFRHNGTEKKKEISKWSGIYGLDVSVSLMRLVISP